MSAAHARSRPGGKRALRRVLITAGTLCLFAGGFLAISSPYITAPYTGVIATGGLAAGVLLLCLAWVTADALPEPPPVLMLPAPSAKPAEAADTGRPDELLVVAEAVGVAETTMPLGDVRVPVYQDLPGTDRAIEAWRGAIAAPIPRALRRQLCQLALAEASREPDALQRVLGAVDSVLDTLAALAPVDQSETDHQMWPRVDQDVVKAALVAAARQGAAS